MTQEEIEKLDFGTIIYNNAGDRYVLLNTFDDRFVVAAEIDCSVTDISWSGGYNLHLENPKGGTK